MMRMRVPMLTGLVRWIWAGGGEHRARLEGMWLGESQPGQNLAERVRLMWIPWWS